MSQHLKEDKIIGYVHGTLTDAQRETMDQHIQACPACRNQLSEHETLVRRLRYELAADLQKTSPSPSMKFEEIEANIKHTKIQYYPLQLLPVATALMGLILAFISASSSFLRSGTQTSPTLPTIACFLFSLPLVTEHKKRSKIAPQRVVVYLLAFILWLGTAAIGLYEIFLLRNMLMRLYALALARGGDITLSLRHYWTAVAIGQWGVFFLAAVWLGVFVGSGEYHYRHVGEHGSWRLFEWIVGVEILILLLALVI